MFRNNFKIAVRTILKQRMYAVLNILGLGVGMASCLLISFYVSEETSYDQFYKDAENVYRITTSLKIDGDESLFATAPPPLGPLVLQQIPEVTSMVRLYKGGDMTMRADHDFDNPFRETNAWSVDEGFFEVFDYGFIAGDFKTLFTEPKTLVMPKSTAIRYFGQEAFDQSNIVGRFLGGGGDGGTPWKVVGIMEDQPKTSHFQFVILLSAVDESVRKMQIWSWNSFHTYIRLGDNNKATIAAVEKGLGQIVLNYALPSSNDPAGLTLSDDLAWKYQLQPIADIHLTPSLIREMRPKGNQLYVNSLIVVAAFIIILACVNFINLSTAKSSIRAKEIGVKKVLGSGRLNLIYQFLVESLLFSFMSLILAFGISEIMIMILDNYFQWQLNTSLLNLLSSWLIIIGSTTFVGLAAGIYPALYLTGFKPIAVLKGDFTHGSAKTNLRNVLVGFQFVISIGLIISALIIQRQVEYANSKDLGFDKSNVLVIQNDREIDDRREEFKIFLGNNPSIQSVSFATGLPGQLQYPRRDFMLDGAISNTGINWFQADEQYLKSLDLKLIEGRSFSTQLGNSENTVLVNEQAVKELGLTDPIGTYMTINKGENDEQRVQIIGVLADFNLESFDKKIQSLVIQYLDDFVFKDYIAIRVQSNDLVSTIETIEAAWTKFEPNVPLVYSFLDKDFDKLFKSEQQLSKIFTAFTALAIFIACLGLFGLASYMNEQRTKEIGIRKVLGASLLSILTLLYKSYFKLILGAFVIAAGLSFYFMQDWLQSFVYRIEFSAEPFVLALVGTIVLAIITVAYQSIKTAYKNPVDTLKSE
jgi:putative ABC transport system permease protein